MRFSLPSFERLSDRGLTERLEGMNPTTDRLVSAWESTPRAHRVTLLGERRAGSKWGRGFTLTDWDALLEGWNENTHVALEARMPGCTYFITHIGHLFPDATLGAVPWDSLAPSEREEVVDVVGPHGPELQLTARALKFKPRAEYATLIVGPDEGLEVVFTIHPGLPLRPGIERRGKTAVKLV
jgi:hypothetical protein